MADPAPQVVLASASPRRAELLGRLGYEIAVHPADIDESTRDGEPPADYTARVAAEKARSVWEPGSVVVAADTCVVSDDEVLGKPADASDAIRMLHLLAGRAHTVLTAVCVIGRDGSEVRLQASAVVRMAPADPDVLAGYVAGGEPMDKAGAYALQGQGAALVESVEGDPTTVIGLPLGPTVAALRRVGITAPAFDA